MGNPNDDRNAGEPHRGEAQVSAPPLDFLWRVLDEIDYGLVLVNELRRIHHANHLARRELLRGRNIRVAEGAFAGCTEVATQQIQAAVNAAAGGCRRLLTLVSDGERLPVAVIPLQPMENGSPAVLIALPRLSAQENLTLGFFAREQAITPAEETVLRALCDGQGIGEIAAAHQVAECTVRSQVRALRDKTNTRNMRQLLQCVAALPPVVPALRKGFAVI